MQEGVFVARRKGTFYSREIVVVADAQPIIDVRVASLILEREKEQLTTDIG
jgi:hypothetical protein